VSLTSLSPSLRGEGRGEGRPSVQTGLIPDSLDREQS
jgi:hypothetical protein